MPQLNDPSTLRRRGTPPFGQSNNDGGIPTTPPSPWRGQSASAPDYGALAQQALTNAKAAKSRLNDLGQTTPRFGGALMTDMQTTARGQAADQAQTQGNLASWFQSHANQPNPPNAAAATPTLTGDGLGTPANAVAAASKPQSPPVLWNQSVDQMRGSGVIPDKPPVVPAGQLPSVPNIRPAIETGVTLPGGRKLSYGATVNGVPTFSDGSGGMPGHAGTIPRTMTNAEIQSLGERLNTIPAAASATPTLTGDGLGTPASAAPAFNSDNSEANIAAILRSRQGGRFGVTPEMNASADLAAVTNQDPRSTLGRAALNASRRANAASTTLQRKSALAGLAGLQDAVTRNAAAGIAGANTLDNTAATNAGALDRANVAGRYDLAGILARSQGDLARQNLANQGDLAKTDLAGQYDVMGRIAQGQARTGLSDKDLNAQALKLMPQVLGLDANMQIADPKAPGGARTATQQELAAALARSKEIIQGQLAPSGRAAPKPGDVQGGYRFKGGNPNDQASWEKI